MASTILTLKSVIVSYGAGISILYGKSASLIVAKYTQVTNVVSQTYTLYYNSAIKKGMFQSGITSAPAMQFIDPANNANIIDGVFIEEVPTTTVGVDSISFCILFNNFLLVIKFLFKEIIYNKNMIILKIIIYQ